MVKDFLYLIKERFKRTWQDVPGYVLASVKIFPPFFFHVFKALLIIAVIASWLKLLVDYSFY